MRIVVDRSQMGPRLQTVPVDGPVFWSTEHTFAEMAEEFSIELQGYTSVLMGRVPPPINRGVMTLMEVAEAYYARGQEINMEILRKEREGLVTKGTALYRFRTGELRAFLELTKKAIDLGSRRITFEQMLYEQRYDAPPMDTAVVNEFDEDDDDQPS
jgi:hypothetical protein